MDRDGLADFLRRRRDALQPGDLGLSAGSRRRTQGLRREEVAGLAHMSTDFYARLEQRRGSRPSEQTTAALARWWFASDFVIEVGSFFTPILGGCPGPGPGGRNDGERQAAQAAAVAGGEVGGVPRGLLAGALAGRCSPKVGRRREYGDPDQAAGQGRGAGGVRGLEAGADTV